MSFINNFKKKSGIVSDNSGTQKSNYNSKTDPCKLIPLLKSLDVIPADTDFIMLDFNKIKKTRTKI
jgi:hypothetical protein